MIDESAPAEVTVLLVDDNAQNLKVLYETLKDQGYRLLVANDGEKALALADRDQPEVILLDIMMPGLDGYEVCRRLKNSPRTSDSAVIFLSALDDVGAKVEGFEVGGADYVSKPFQSQEVIARVRTHARIVRLERELQQRNRDLEGDRSRILNAISEGIYGLDARGIIIYANPAAAEICHGSAAELVGQSFCALHQTEDSQPAAVSGPFAQLTCEQGIAEHRRGVPMRRLDGTVFFSEYRSSPKYDGDTLLGAVVVFSDITDELEKERELSQAEQVMQSQRDQLAHFARVGTMGEMAAGVAHEVNQPLTAIANYARVARRMIGDGSGDCELLRTTLEKIEAQSHRASEVIRRIRQFVKKPAMGKEWVKLPELLEDTRQFAEVDARNNRGSVQLHVPADLPALLVDPIQVQQVALNLIRNALEATRSVDSSAPIDVTVTKLSDGKFVRVAVTDTGPGVDPEVESELFHPFFTTKENGMGIGLAMCRSLINAQGGEIGFERPDNGGARFFFTLPVGSDGETGDEAEVSG